MLLDLIFVFGFVAVFLIALMVTHAFVLMVRGLWRAFFPPKVRVIGVKKWRN